MELNIEQWDKKMIIIVMFGFELKFNEMHELHFKRITLEIKIIVVN